MHEEERTLWEGHPSHLKDLGTHIVCGLLFWTVVPLGIMLWRYLETRHTWFEVTSERIRLTRGILSKRVDEMELYRVKDSRLDQPFFLRLFGLSNLVIKTSDQSTPIIIIHALPEAEVLRENLRGCVEKLRQAKGVREVDYR